MPPRFAAFVADAAVPALVAELAVPAVVAKFAVLAVFALEAVIPMSPLPSPTNPVAATVPFTVWFPVKVLPPFNWAKPTLGLGCKRMEALFAFELTLEAAR